MAWILGGLTLGTTSAVERAQDAHDSLSLELAVTATERAQLQEMLEHAGQLTEQQAFQGGIQILDASPGGTNTIFVDPDTTLEHAAWYVAEALSDDWAGSTTVNRMQVTLRRLGGPSEVTGRTNSTTLFESHDF